MSQLTEIAAAIRLAADAAFDESWGLCVYDAFTNEMSADAAFKRMLERDWQDMYEVATMLDNEFIAEALAKATSLDTVVRDDFPETFWKLDDSALTSKHYIVRLDGGDDNSVVVRASSVRAATKAAQHYYNYDESGNKWNDVTLDQLDATLVDYIIG